MAQGMPGTAAVESRKTLLHVDKLSGVPCQPAFESLHFLLRCLCWSTLRSGRSKKQPAMTFRYRAILCERAVTRLAFCST